MRIVFFTLFLFLTVSASAEPISFFQVTNVTITAPNFTAGPTTTMNGKEITTYHDVSGASFTVSVMRGGMPDSGGIAFIWAALLSNTPFPDNIGVKLTADMTVLGHELKGVVLQGVLGFSNDGMYWRTLMPAFTAQATDGALIGLSFTHNLPGIARGATWGATVDARVNAAVLGGPQLPVTPTPEPATLLTLSLGMGLAARRMRARKNSRSSDTSSGAATG